MICTPKGGHRLLALEELPHRRWEAPYSLTEYAIEDLDRYPLVKTMQWEGNTLPEVSTGATIQGVYTAQVRTRTGLKPCTRKFDQYALEDRGSTWPCTEDRSSAIKPSVASHRRFIQLEEKHCRRKNDPDEIIGHFEGHFGQRVQRADIVQLWDWAADLMVKPEYVRLGTMRQIVQRLKESLFSIHQRGKHQGPEKARQSTVLHPTMPPRGRAWGGRGSTGADGKKEIVSVCQRPNNPRLAQSDRQRIVCADPTILQRPQFVYVWG